MDLTIALDVGGMSIKAALVTCDGAALHTTRRPTGREGGTDAIITSICDLSVELLERAGVLGGQPLAAGVAVPGLVDEAKGKAVYAANLGWRDVALGELLRARLGLPVVVCHDVRAGGIAEGRLGAARGIRHFLFVPIGTGIGAAIIIDGQAYAGAHGGAGEIGHISVRATGPRCNCGALGCLETLASAAAITRSYAETTGRFDTTAEEVASRVAAEDPVAVGVWAEAVDALADGIVVVARVLDPELVVIGGGLATAGETLLRPLRTAVARRATFQQAPRLVAAALGDQAGCLGAGLLAWEAVDATPGAGP